MNVACVWVRVGVGFLSAAASAMVVGGLLGQQKMTTEIVSRASNDDNSNSYSYTARCSADGRYVVFTSLASNLVPGDTNGNFDVFLRDNQTGITTLASVASDGTHGNNASTDCSISSTGRYVVFRSASNNLVAGDTNNVEDVFERDLVTGMTTMVSIAYNGLLGDRPSTIPTVSSDGRFVAFLSNATNLVVGDTNAMADVFVRDTVSNTIVRANVSTSGTEANHGSDSPCMSDDGRYVAFQSSADNLVSGDTNSVDDVFLRDLQAGTTTRLSVASGGAQADYPCMHPSISRDGHFVVFSSLATALVPGDTNDRWDVFLCDLVGNTISRVSVSTDGTQSNGSCIYCDVGNGGQFVAFWSEGTNLVPGDTNGQNDIFLRDVSAGTTRRMSVATNGTQGDAGCFEPSISADGRFVAFPTASTTLVPGDLNGQEDIFLRDAVIGTTKRISTAMNSTNGPSASDSFSEDGRFVAYWSFASNIVPGDTNGVADIFVRNLVSGTNERVSVSSGGTQATSTCEDPSISGDGRYVAFWSLSSNLVPNDTNGKNDVFLRDRQTGTTLRVSTDSNAGQSNEISFYPKMSSNGTYVVFFSSATNLVPGDTNGFIDVFVKNIQSGATTRASLAHDGSQGNGPSVYPFVSISDDGRYVAFASDATNLVPGDTNGQPDVFVRDMVANTTTRISVSSAGVESDGDSRYPTMTPDGRYVVFQSLATNLVTGDTNGVNDIFLRNLQTGTTTRLSVATDGTEANGASNTPSISANGRFVAYPSVATNLVSNDTNGKSDVFRRDLVTGITSRISVQTNGGQCDGFSSDPSVISSGSVAFRSDATNLVPGDTNGFMDVFVRRVMAFQRRGP